MRALEQLWQDVKYGLRGFARTPAVALIAVVSMAFGTGANVAMFSVVDALLLRPLPVKRPSEIVTVGAAVRHGRRTESLSSYPEFLDLRARATTLTGLAAARLEPVALTLRADAPPKVRLATFVSDNFFHVLGVEPSIGRGFEPADDVREVAILSDDLWHSEFDGDPRALGRTIRISGRDFTIVGVTPASFSGLGKYVRDAVYVPAASLPSVAAIGWAGPDPLHSRSARLFELKGRLGPGVTRAAATAEVAGIGQSLADAYPETNARVTFDVKTEFEVQVEQQPLDTSLVALQAVLALAVLIVACANVAGLLTSRAPVRAREMAMRLAVGASRARLIRQLATETLLLALAGAAAGLLVAQIGIELLRQIQFPTDMVSVPRFELDTRALMFSIGLALVTTALVGLGPAIQSTRVDLFSTLKRADAPVRRRRWSLRPILVAAQIALSLVLLTIWAFAMEAFTRQLATGPGFRTTDLAKVTATPGQAGYSDAESAPFFTRVLADLRTRPGIQSAALTSTMPLYGYRYAPVLPEGWEPPPGQSGRDVFAFSIDEDYFQTMDVPILSGRAFTAADTESAAPVIIVNDTFARHYWPGETAIGRRVRLLEHDGRWFDVVGVATTTQYGFPGEVPQEGVFFHYRQRPRAEMVVVARTMNDSASGLQPVQDSIAHVDRDVPVRDVQTVEAFLSARVTSVATVILRLIGGMGLMGLALTMVGLYGLVSYGVNRRFKEIGIRIAIGATASQIIRMVLRDGTRPVWWGLGVGVVLSALTTRVLANTMPFGADLKLTVSLLVAPGVAAVAIGAALLPSRRASRINPVAALRQE